MVFVGEFAASLKQQRVGIRAPEAPPPPSPPPQAPPPGPVPPVSAPPLPPIAQVSSTESTTMCQSTLLAKGLDCIRTPKHYQQDATISNTAMFVPAVDSSKSSTPGIKQSTHKVFI